MNIHDGQIICKIWRCNLPSVDILASFTERIYHYFHDVATITGVYDAVDQTRACLQIDTPAPPDVGEQSEDCLHLNMWRPRPFKGSRAVMVR